MKHWSGHDSLRPDDERLLVVVIDGSFVCDSGSEGQDESVAKPLTGTQVVLVFDAKTHEFEADVMLAAGHELKDGELGEMQPLPLALLTQPPASD